MEDEHLRAGFGNAVTQSFVSPIVLLVVLVLGLLICFGSRRRAISAFLAGAILIPMDQILLIGPLHFPMLRVLILCGIVRMIRTRSSSKSGFLAARWNPIDTAVLVFTCFTAVDGILLFQDTSALIFQSGNLLTALGSYLLLRFLIHDEDDVLQVLRSFAWIAAAAAVVMSFEQITGRNPLYSLLGGAHANMYGTVMERGGRRATGPFGHPILAGTFGAFMLPLMLGLWFRGRKYRNIGLAGMASCAVMSATANSSTALLGLFGGILAWGFWKLRKSMRPIRWGILVTLITLHLVMKAPVWHLISYVDLSGGSASYHRFQVLNQCILHFSDWWLIGTKYYGDWGWDMWDLGNQYVAIADTAGLVPLVAFLATIVYAFKYIGKLRRAVAKVDRKQELLMWGVGASLFANVVAFFGISYFDQTLIAWSALLAIIPALAVTYVQKLKAKPCHDSVETHEAFAETVEIHSLAAHDRPAPYAFQ